MPTINAPAVRRFQLLVRIAALTVMGIGCGGFLGWVLDSEPLKSPLQDGITIKANAAVGLLLAGAALWFLRRSPESTAQARWWGKICAALAGLLGGLTLFQHLSGIDLGIDQLFFHEPPGALATSSPGRMGRPASSCLLMAGLAMLLLDGRTTGRRLTVQLLAGSVCAVMLVPLVGFVFGVAQLYGVAGYTGIALHTAIAILILGLGILFSRPTEGVMAVVCADDAGGLMARRLVPLAFIFPIVTWWVRILAEDIGWIDTALARPLAVLFLSVCSVLAVVWNARAMSRLELQRRKLEYERQRGSERMVEILESIGDAFYAIDAAGRFTYVNRQAEELWGRARDSLMGRNLWTELPEAINETESAAHRAVLNHRQQRSYETFSLRLGHWFEVSLYPESGGGVSGFFRDVTRQKQVEEELRRARDSAEHANRAKSDFLATLSHEIRTPLNPVLLTLDYIEAHHEFPPALREEVASIRRHVDLEIQLISDLLDVTRIESGKFELNLSAVDVHEVVHEAVTMCRRSDGPEIALELRAEKHVVRGDAVRLHQVVWNLLNNAQKFTESAGRVCIRTSVPRAGTIQIEVIDNGSGIAPDVMPRIFDPFEQGETRTARQRGGLGLGLSITRKVVEAHGGSIAATSEGVGRGARFAVELPALDIAPAQPLPPATTTLDVGSTSWRILLVEDHAPTLQAVARLLTMMGHRVTTAATAEDAENAATAGAFDLLISDVGLPDKSGLELMKSLRSQFAGRAIAVTGYGTDEDIRSAREAGFSEHITKPVRISVLKTAIARVMG